MAIQFSYSGAVLVEWGTTPINLGYSRDGCTVSIQPFWHDIQTDITGGTAGPPSERQFMGALAHVIVDFTKYEKSEMDKLHSFKKSGTAGIMPAPGTLMHQDSHYDQLKLEGANIDETFAKAFIYERQEFNSGMKARAYRVGWEIWMDDWDSTYRLMTIA